MIIKNNNSLIKNNLNAIENCCSFCKVEQYFNNVDGVWISELPILTHLDGEYFENSSWIEIDGEIIYVEVRYECCVVKGGYWKEISRNTNKFIVSLPYSGNLNGDWSDCVENSSVVYIQRFFNKHIRVKFEGIFKNYNCISCHDLFKSLTLEVPISFTVNNLDESKFYPVGYPTCLCEDVVRFFPIFPAPLFEIDEDDISIPSWPDPIPPDPDPDPELPMELPVCCQIWTRYLCRDDGWIEDSENCRIASFTPQEWKDWANEWIAWKKQEIAEVEPLPPEPQPPTEDCPEIEYGDDWYFVGCECRNIVRNFECTWNGSWQQIGTDYVYYVPCPPWPWTCPHSDSPPTDYEVGEGSWSCGSSTATYTLYQVIPIVEYTEISTKYTPLTP